MDQPGKVANSARGQLNRENDIFPCPRSRLRIWSRETGSAVLSRVSLIILHTQAESGLPIHAIEPVPSLSGHAIAYRWRSLPRVRRHRASIYIGLKVVPVMIGLFVGDDGPVKVCLSFPNCFMAFLLRYAPCE